jgi:hypothetical protein
MALWLHPVGIMATARFETVHDELATVTGGYSLGEVATLGGLGGVATSLLTGVVARGRARTQAYSEGYRRRALDAVGNQAFRADAEQWFGPGVFLGLAGDALVQKARESKR